MPSENSAVARSLDAGPVLTKRMTLGEARAWALLIVGIAYWTNLIRMHSTGASVSLGAIANSVIYAGAFDLLAWVVIFEYASSLAKQKLASRWDILQTLLIGAVCAVPTRQTVVAGMLILGFFLYTGRNKSVFSRRIFVILSALSVEIIWTSPYLEFLHVCVGKIDAQMVAAIYRGFGHAVSAHGNVVENVGANFSIIVLAQCASSFILTGTGVAFLVTALFRHEILGRSSILWLSGCLIVSVILTELRLVLMVRSEAYYDWWHHGPGLSVYSLTATVSAVCFSIAATRKRVPMKSTEQG